MSIPRHHAEWLSLIEVSGPFLSLPVLQRAFPQGLEPHQPERARLLRLAYDEWQDAVESRRNVAPLHHAWIEFVLTRLFQLPSDLLLTGQTIPPTLVAHVPEHHETLRPDFVLADPADAARPRLLVQVYPPGQHLDKPVAGHTWKASPATRMMDLLHAANVRLGLVTDGERWMLVDAPRNETTGFASWYAALWLEEPITLRAFTSLLGADRFFNVPAADTLEALLAESAGNQQEVTDQLGYQVRRAVEVLVQSLDRADQDAGRTLLAAVDEKSIYASALTVMMRLVFLFSAEERGLLLLHDELYAAHYAVSTLREQLRHAADQHGEEILERRRDAWSRLLATFRAVFGGLRHDRLTLPAYGGNLFDPDRYPFLEGRPADTSWRDTPADPLPIHNRTVLHLLDALQMLEVKTPGGERQARRLSFRALDIEQIGHVYEGLLDHTARRAGAGEPVLGLKGTRAKEPEIPLAVLDQLRAKNDGDVALSEFLRAETGRSASALKRDLLTATSPTTLLDTEEKNRLRTACGQDEALFQRVVPFAGLIRLDTFEYPLVVQPGSLYVTAGSDRRSTGTHYTPRSLTEPIVRYTLEPLVYRGPAEGSQREQWQLKTPRELLALKVCDLAMGSGAFLVAACRYLAARLVEAWTEIERVNPAAFITSPDGDISTGNPEDALIARLPDDERMHLAMRSVADRCLYGVDINPMAVEMAKLSLWLVTVDRQRPFTFLDHALKCGDSLLGISDTRQLERFSLRPTDEAQPLLETANLWRNIEQAATLRRQLEGLPSHNSTQLDEKARLHAEAEAALAKLRAAADFLVAAELDNPGDRGWETRRALAASHMQAGWKREVAEFRSLARTELRGRRAFHWPLEFPELLEIDENAKAFMGFDTFVGNPPFMGGQKITGELGTDYRDYLVTKIANGQRGSADYCAYFFLRVHSLLNPAHGMAGLVATNTIAQGDTREVGLEQIAAAGASIPRAVPSQPWPGVAALEVAHVWFRRGAWAGEWTLDERAVSGITAFLTEPSSAIGFPFRLASNANKSFKGSDLMGAGFIISNETANSLIEKDSKNRDVVFSFMNGEDLHSTIDQSGTRSVICFFDWPLERKVGEVGPVANDYPDALAIVKREVFPYRTARNADGIFTLRRPLPQKWWIFNCARAELYSTISNLSSVLVKAETTDTYAFTRISPGRIFSHALYIFAFSETEIFAVVQSSFHEAWARTYGSSMKRDLRYTPGTCFDTFPFPEHLAILSSIGNEYNNYRQKIMQSREEGLTKIYKRFHDQAQTFEDVRKLRALHRQLDTAVAAAYGWSDLAANDGSALGHDFHETKQGIRFTLAPVVRREVLDRLFTLNHQRYAEEVASGLHEKKKVKTARGKAAVAQSDSHEMSLDFDQSASTKPTSETVFAATLIIGLLAEAQRQTTPLRMSRLKQAFDFVSQPAQMERAASNATRGAVKAWAAKWHSPVAPDRFIPTLKMLRTGTVKATTNEDDPLMGLVTKPVLIESPDLQEGIRLAVQVACSAPPLAKDSMETLIRERHTLFATA